MTIINYRKIFFVISAILLVASIFAMFRFGFKFGIDFTGGSIYEVKYVENIPDIDTVRSFVARAGIENHNITPSGQDAYIIRMPEISNDAKNELKNSLENFGDLEMTEERFSSIGPSVGNELKNKALVAIAIATICIVLFITFAFRKVSQPISSWKYGLATILSLVHDVIIPTGIFVIWIHFTGGQTDILFVSAILAVLGYSVHDTIVVFDRVRENLGSIQSTGKKEPFEETVGKSVTQTLGRSINTSLTTLIVLTCLFFLGGEATKDFVFVLIIGMIVGTYSSIFIASPLLVTMYKLQLRK